MPYQTETKRMTSPSSNWNQTDKWVLAGLIGLVVARIIALLMTPLTLNVDEAQYWVWSQNLDFGYYSKPPLIAWLIGISHAIFGHASWAVRLPAPVLHFAISLILWRIASLIYGARAGQIAGLLWAVMPATGLGSLVISTDSPLLLFWSAALLFFIKAETASAHDEPSQRNRWMFAAGLAAGIAMLGKYAALYFLLGAALYLLAVRKQRAVSQIIMLLAGFLIAASPNLLWNLSNGFVTFQHLGENANLGAPSYSLAQLSRFVIAQFGVFGPLTLSLVIIAAMGKSKYRFLLMSFSLPVLLIMMGQAFLKEANANWAVTAYPALTLLLAGWLAQASGARSVRARAGLLALSINAGLIFIVTLSAAFGDFGRLTPKSDPLRRMRGWDVLAADITPHLDNYAVRTVLADSRAAAAILPFYLYPRDVEVRLFDHDNQPSNHFERAFNFTENSPLPALAIVAPDAQPVPDFVKWSGPVGNSNVVISYRRSREKTFFISD